MIPAPRVILVTGASSGIGRAAASRFAARGEHLVLLARAGAPLREVAGECSAAASVLTLEVDVTDAPAVSAAVQRTVAEHGRLDAVVHSAGIAAYGRFEDVPKAVFDRVLEVNVLGAANVARAALPVFRGQRRGSLIVLGSVLGEIAVPTMSPYVVSKWALRALGRELALENRDLPDVHVTVVSPGGVDTPIYTQAANVLGRPGRPPVPVDSPERVARAVVRALDRPRDRVGVGVTNPVMRVGFTFAPWLFDSLVGPLFRQIGLERRSVPPTEGNAFEPQPELAATSGDKGSGVRAVLATTAGHPLS